MVYLCNLIANMNLYLVSLSLIGGVLITGGIVLLFTDLISAKKRYINAFAAAIVTALIFVHILPEIYEVKSVGIGFTLMAGMIFQLFLEKITHGVEHGHDHAHSKGHKSILIGLFIGLGIHALVEGIPLFLGEVEGIEEVANQHQHHHHHHDHGHDHGDGASTNSKWKYISAIIVHNIPLTVIISLFLFSLEISKIRFFLFIFLFSIMTPIGASLGFAFSESSNLHIYGNYFMAFSTGMLLHIITSILFEHSHSKRESNLHLIIITAGIIVGTLLFNF